MPALARKPGGDDRHVFKDGWRRGAGADAGIGELCHAMVPPSDGGRWGTESISVPRSGSSGVRYGVGRVADEFRGSLGRSVRRRRAALPGSGGGCGGEKPGSRWSGPPGVCSGRMRELRWMRACDRTWSILRFRGSDAGPVRKDSLSRSRARRPSSGFPFTRRSADRFRPIHDPATGGGLAGALAALRRAWSGQGGADMLGPPRLRSVLVRTIASLLLLFLLALAVPSSASVGGELRIASWNLEHLNDTDGAGCVPRESADYDAMARQVAVLGADIVAFQEVENEAAARRVFPPAGWHVAVSSRSSHESRPCLLAAAGGASRTLGDGVRDPSRHHLAPQRGPDRLGGG